MAVLGLLLAGATCGPNAARELRQRLFVDHPIATDLVGAEEPEPDQFRNSGSRYAQALGCNSSADDRHSAYIGSSAVGERKIVVENTFACDSIYCMQLTAAISARASDLVHHEDDQIDVHIQICVTAADGREAATFFWGLICTDYWDNARVSETYKCTLDAPMDDIQTLAIAVFERLSLSLREFGTDLASVTYTTHEALLSEVETAVAARLNQSIRRKLGILGVGTVTAVRKY